MKTVFILNSPTCSACGRPAPCDCQTRNARKPLGIERPPAPDDGIERIDQPPTRNGLRPLPSFRPRPGSTKPADQPQAPAPQRLRPLPLPRDHT